MYRNLKIWSVLLLLVCVAGCGSISRDQNSSSTDPIVPAKTINLTKSLTIPFETVAAGALIYLIVDPLAPNWKIQEAQLAEDKFQIALEKKRFSVGGDGEAIQVFHRRAKQIVLGRGYTDYQILEYTEGIESKTLGARRVSYGIIQITKPSKKNG